MPPRKNPSPILDRLNTEARAVRRILNTVSELDSNSRARVLRTVLELANEAIGLPTPEAEPEPADGNGADFAG